MKRNSFVKDDWILENVTDLSVCSSFSCGDDDLDDYFHVDAVWHREELISQTYTIFTKVLHRIYILLF